jgi:hypothetical protein
VYNIQFLIFFKEKTKLLVHTIHKAFSFLFLLLLLQNFFRRASATTSCGHGKCKPRRRFRNHRPRPNIRRKYTPKPVR